MGHYDSMYELSNSLSSAIEKRRDEKVRQAIKDITEENINHPLHYNMYKDVEVIQLAEQMSFCRGSAVKYIARAGLKSKETELEDLKKAKWCIEREIETLEKQQASVSWEGNF